ncbi:YraN family protein [Temperatibacter marinus]|uniref:UPF0102 protein QGN29_04560 n=1 Tax=Temperatibacter marinus TaxID=1456591 RepID=A0AA52EF88_9PROT|nr:YraN family protein [Temperatibacter marinus]WND03645.1 YraN family protein [Temperatibacter marinus]
MRQRRRAEQKGRWAERYSAWTLRFKGYKILEQRYKTPVGEIDLIAKQGHLLVFVEVKARATIDAGLASISYRQKDRIKRAALLYCQKIYHKGAVRFDAMVKADDHFFVKHIEAAWR